MVVIDKLITPFSEQLEIQNTVGWDSYNTDQGVTSDKDSPWLTTFSSVLDK